MDTYKIELCVDKFIESIKLIYKQYIKPILDKIKSLFKFYKDLPIRMKFKPIKRILPTVYTDFHKYRIIHCRNNC